MTRRPVVDYRPQHGANAGAASQRHYQAAKQAPLSEQFDWDHAIALLRKTLADVYRRRR